MEEVSGRACGEGGELMSWVCVQGALAFRRRGFASLSGVCDARSMCVRRANGLSEALPREVPREELTSGCQGTTCEPGTAQGAIRGVGGLYCST